MTEEVQRAVADRLSQRDDVRALFGRFIRSVVIWADRLVLPTGIYRHHADAARRERLQQPDEVFLGAAVPGDQQRRGMDLTRWRGNVSGELAPRCVESYSPGGGRQIKESRCAHAPSSPTPGSQSARYLAASGGDEGVRRGGWRSLRYRTRP